MSGNRVELKIEDGIAYLAFQGENDLNLLTLELALKLQNALDEVAEKAEARVVVLRGHGDRAFSAGVDIKKLKAFSPSEAENFIRHLHQVMRRVMKLKKPVIASVMGPCLGGAMELATACDLTVAAEDALFGLPEIRVGVPSVIEAYLLDRIIGWSKARELILTGDIIDAREAFRLGLVNRLVPRDRLQEETLNVAKRLLGFSPRILGVQKDILDKWLNLGEEQGTEYSIKAFALCFSTTHPREGMEAFLERREPVYSSD